MAELQVPVDVEGYIENPELWEEQIRDLVLEEGDFEPCTIVVDSEHAVYVEFGTGPATRRQKDPNVDVHGEIEKWVEIKLGIKDPKRRRRVADRVYHSIMEHGMPPSPYLRPAVFKVLENLPNDWFSDGGTTRELAELIVVEMKRQLEQNNTIYTGEIAQSIQVVRGEVEESEVQSKVSKEVWNEKDLAYDGVRRARRRS